MIGRSTRERTHWKSVLTSRVAARRSLGWENAEKRSSGPDGRLKSMFRSAGAEGMIGNRNAWIGAVAGTGHSLRSV